jgi:hypothetical protein
MPLFDDFPCIARKPGQYPRKIPIGLGIGERVDRLAHVVAVGG